MDTFLTYIPVDRRLALAHQRPLPDRSAGAALFADISGFTPLTERLTHLLGPRRGAEELSSHLNVVYDALINQIEYFGGSVISFAGDAITCWFDEERGPASLRAVAAALAMQTVMSAFATITITKGHTASLAMKTAVTTGSARRFLVGDPNIQRLDTLAGQMIDRLSMAEKLAHPGELLVDEATQTRLAADLAVAEWRRDPKTGTPFAQVNELHQAVPAFHWPLLPPDALTLTQIRPWLLTAVYDREQMGRGEFLTELRPAVALFLSFRGLNYEDDPDVGQKLDDFVCRVQNVLTHYGGTLLQLTIGDKGSYLYASFGALVAHEDDTYRAANAGLELEKLPLLANTPVQIGISRGIMRAGSYGGSRRRTYGVLGDDVNLAARLMQHAAPGQILVSESVQRILQRGFYLELASTMQLKGKQTAVAVYALDRRRRPQTGYLKEAEYAIPLVGRDAEYALITRKIQQARNGAGQVIGIMAEAGMGKTRLVAEVIKQARLAHYAVFMGECQSYGANISYLVWLSIWYQFFDLDATLPIAEQTAKLTKQVRMLAPERQKALPLLGNMLNLPIPSNPFTESLEPQSRRSALEALLLACVQAQAHAAAAQESALIFVFEDVHWIDPVSHDLLDSLARAITQLPVVILLAYRPPEEFRLQKPRLEQLPHFTAVHLAELSPKEAKLLIQAKLRQQFATTFAEVPPPLIAQLTDRAQGNPFYVEELINYLHDKGVDLRQPDALAELELPTSLHSLILSRIDQLNEAQKLTLKIASIIGRLFRFSWLLGYYPELGHMTQVKEHLNELARLDLTPVDQPEPELVYMFKHIVTQEVTYRSLPYATRATLHEQLALYIESLDPQRFIDLLAFHFERSENLPKKREYLTKAGEAAAARFATEEALDYFSRSLALTPDDDIPALFHLHQQREQLYNLQGDRQRQKADLEQVKRLARLLRDESKEAEASLREARFAEMTGEYEAACEASQQALAFAQLGRRRDQEAAAYLQWGRALFRQAEYEKARRCFRHAHALAEKAQETELAADCLMNSGNVDWTQGLYQDALDQYSQALSLKQQTGNRRGESILLNNMGVVALSQSDYETAQTYYVQALAIMREIGDRRNESFVLGNLGLVAANLGQYSSAEAYQTQSLQLRREMADSYGENLSLLNLGTAAFYQGEYAQAEALYEKVLGQYRAVHNKQGEVEVLVYLSLLWHQQDDQEQALAFGQQAVQLTEKLGLRSESALAWRNMGHVQAAFQLWAEATEAYEQAEAICAELGNENLRQEVRAGLARVALAQNDLPTAVAHTETILAHLQTGNLHGTDEPLRVYLTCYQVCQAAGDHQATAVLTAAYNLLLARAERIEDDQKRQSYLEAVPYHREIMALSAAALTG